MYFEMIKDDLLKAFNRNKEFVALVAIGKCKTVNNPNVWMIFSSIHLTRLLGHKLIKEWNTGLKTENMFVFGT